MLRTETGGFVRLDGRGPTPFWTVEVRGPSPERKGAAMTDAGGDRPQAPEEEWTCGKWWEPDPHPLRVWFGYHPL